MHGIAESNDRYGADGRPWAGVVVKTLVENLGLILLLCIGLRFGAELIEPVLPLLGGLFVACVIGLWLLGRGGFGGGYR